MGVEEAVRLFRKGTNSSNGRKPYTADRKPTVSSGAKTLTHFQSCDLCFHISFFESDVFTEVGRSLNVSSDHHLSSRKMRQFFSSCFYVFANCFIYYRGIEHF